AVAQHVPGLDGQEQLRVPGNVFALTQDARTGVQEGLQFFACSAFAETWPRIRSTIFSAMAWCHSLRSSTTTAQTSGENGTGSELPAAPTRSASVKPSQPVT